MAHIRQSRPKSGLGFQVQVLKTLKVVPYSLGSGLASRSSLARVARQSCSYGFIREAEKFDKQEARRERIKTLLGLLSENGSSQGQNLALTVLHVPYSLDGRLTRVGRQSCSYSHRALGIGLL